MKESTDGKCVFCGGKIVKLIVGEHDPMWGSRIVGPGSRRQQREVSRGYHCENCDIKYKLVPQRKRRAAQQ